MLYGVQTTDPFIYAVVALLGVGLPLAAIDLPAGRRTKLEPMVALRQGIGHSKDLFAAI